MSDDTTDTEVALLLAVRDILREKGGYAESECDCEYDEEPSIVTVGDVYLAVVPAGWSSGPDNGTCGGILDEVVSVDVACIVRGAQFPADTRRSLFMEQLSGLNRHVRKVVTTVGNFQYELHNLANQSLNQYGFVEPLRFGSMESKPREVDARYFGGREGEKHAGMVRVVHLVGARRIQYNVGAT